MQYAKTQIADQSVYTLLTRFIRLFYLHASEEDLKEHTVPELFAIARSHWNLLRSTETHPGACQVRVFNPDEKTDGWHCAHTVVQIMMKDMPFIVDSVRMEIHRMGFSVHLMIYMGGMAVQRNAKGRITDIKAYDKTQNESDVEAPVYVEIDHQTDPAVLHTLKENLMRVLSDVQAAVSDWQPMQQRVRESIQELSSTAIPIEKSEVDESIAFLEWLLSGQFTFLGVRDYRIVGSGDALALQLVPNSGLGVLRDESHSKTTRQFSELPETARALMLSNKQLLIISKTNTVSTVHRLVYTDYIGIKRFDNKGRLCGERRLIGLYTSTAYSSHPKQIPFLRHKVASVLAKSCLPPLSHAGKNLMHILETFPRDDLFQASVEDLYRITTGISNLQDRKKIGFFVREDAYKRYVSCFVFVSRENFSSQLILRVQEVLMHVFHGNEVNYSTYFYTPTLTRIHYNIRTPLNKKVRYNYDEVYKKLSEVTKSWQDGLREAMFLHYDEETGNHLIEKYIHAFSAGYREAFTPANAITDIAHIEALALPLILGMNVYQPAEKKHPCEIKCKLYRYEQTVPLSDALPILENIGMRVIEEQAYLITLKDDRQLWINDFSLLLPKDLTANVEELRQLFQEIFYHVWVGDAENDLFNALVIRAKLNWHEIAVLRAYTKYLRQTGFTYSVHYVAETTLKYPNIARSLVELFHALFDPMQQSKVDIESLDTMIRKQIDEVALVDEDRIFQKLLAVMRATLRTNFYQRDAQQHYKSHISFKLAPNKVPELPLPLPKFEIFVYSPRFEGVHLRSSKVARGGLRWSDRREDFRTEVLGLMKAQQVKNAVIVPSGAKGGFVPKCLPAEGTREEIFQEAIECYRGFIHGLLDVTDNLSASGDAISPKNTVCYDDADPYLVVAADKGTASFSDIANKIAVDRGFWLGDAFASGGSAGYDHKKMGITARGAWVSAGRHFQGLGIKLDHTEITAIGIGDLSGDVFGNGVLLSRRLKLVAAFNHQHIFIDPTPDPESSFNERKRMFHLSRSTWVDYNASLISPGGGVFSRMLKWVTLTPEIKTLLSLEMDRISPSDLIRVILKMPVDLLWNGGIGTYVKATEETHAAVGDRANDTVRINGAELRARVVVEGGNLGLTQLGRIEYAQNGGLINTDFIDNSAGVDCSDHEVNIKILLNSIVASGELSLQHRNQLLATMTDEVASLVLKNNYHQNEAVSLLAELSPKHTNLYIQYIAVQEKAGRINRELEYLPDTKALQERRTNGKGLTRPEIAVLFSYSKIILKEELHNSTLFSDPVFEYYLKKPFPGTLQKKYGHLIAQHRLRDAILATEICNHLVARMGITFVYQMMDETGVSAETVVRAFSVAYEIFHVNEMYAEIEALDYQVEMTLQYQMIDEVIRLVRRTTRWLLHNVRDNLTNMLAVIAYFEPHIKGLYKRLPRLLLGSDKEGVVTRRDQLVAVNVPEEVATRVASARSMYHALNIILAANAYATDVYLVAHIYFALVDHLELQVFRDKINEHSVTHRWSVLAKTMFKADLDKVQRELTASVIRTGGTSRYVNQRVDAWVEKRLEMVTRWRTLLTDLRSDTIVDFSIISVAIRELFELAQT